jgi:hypothetical protein
MAVIQLFDSIYFVALAKAISAGISIFVVVALLSKVRGHKIELRSKHLARLLLIMLGAEIFNNIYWVAAKAPVAYIGLNPSFYRIATCFMRLTWITASLQRYALAQFFASFCPPNRLIAYWMRFIRWFTVVFSGYMAYAAIGRFYATETAQRIVERNIIQVAFVIEVCWMIPVVIYCIKILKKNHLPLIYRRQLTLLTYVFLCPFIGLEWLSTNFTYGVVSVWQNPIKSYSALGIESLIFAWLLYYCAKHMINSRFLNLVSHVKAPHSYDFLDDFNNVLSSLDDVTKPSELEFEARNFFKKAFTIDPRRVHVGIFAAEPDAPAVWMTERTRAVHEVVTHFFNTYIAAPELIKKAEDAGVRPAKITVLTRHDLEFDQFHAASPTVTAFVNFLNTLDADVFIPIHTHYQAVGYVLIDRHIDEERVFNNVELGQMRVFAEYAGNVMTQLRTKSIDAIQQMVHQLHQELFIRHRQKEYYKETVLTLLKDQSKSEIGLVYYRKQRMVFASAGATDLLEVTSLADVSTQQVRGLLHVAQEACQTGREQTVLLRSAGSNRQLLCTAMIDRDPAVAVIVIRPNKTFLDVDQSLRVAQDPSRWDYLLYLETTAIGERIRQALPGGSEGVQRIHHDILRIGIASPAIFLSAPLEDIPDYIGLMQHIGQAQQLTSLTLMQQELAQEHALELFGINSAIEPNRPPALLARLNHTGMLFINNVHLLSSKTQDMLADMINLGWYSPLCSTKKITCTTRIICSSPLDLQELITSERCTAKLGALLAKGELTITAPHLLTQQDRISIIQGYELELNKSMVESEPIALTSSARTRIAEQGHTSFKQLKKEVQDAFTAHLANQDAGGLIYLDDEERQALTPEIIAIIRLGKKAIKDIKSLAKLMQVFKNQAKIADILGVNRSSVYRRCKEFNLE